MMTLLYTNRLTRKALLSLQTAALRALRPAVEFGPGLNVRGWPIVRLAADSRVVFGRNLALISTSYFSEPGVNHPCIVRTLRPGARIIVGDDVGMSGCSVCAAQEVTIGDCCLLGANVLVTDSDFHPIAPEGRRYRHDNVLVAPVHIGDNVFVGAGAMILKGVTIGENSVIGAGSVVTSDIPSNTIAAGVPASAVGVVTDR
jgi:acetyltransferase-like isoleucine patch superfamily enzyme